MKGLFVYFLTVKQNRYTVSVGAPAAPGVRLQPWLWAGAGQEVRRGGELLLALLQLLAVPGKVTFLGRFLEEVLGHVAPLSHLSSPLNNYMQEEEDWTDFKFIQEVIFKGCCIKKDRLICWKTLKLI